MRSGTCPKCSGTEVYGARNGFSLGEYLKVSIRPQIEQWTRGGIVPHQTDDLWHYLCATCGYSETYLHDEEAMAFVRERWVRVTPP